MQSAKQITHIDQTVGKRVREARKALKMTQSDLSAMTGRSSQQIQKYESGENRISAGLLYDLSIILKQSISWFFIDKSRAGSPEGEDKISDFEMCTELLHKLQHRDRLALAKDLLKVLLEEDTNQSAEKLKIL